GNFPPSFPLAAGMGWLLVAAVAIPLSLQARALRGRSYAILSGRTRQAVRRQLSRRSLIGTCAGVGLFFVVALGIPGFGAVSGSLLADYGGSFSLTLENYRALFAQAGLIGPLERSLFYAVLTATITVTGGFIAARMLAPRRGTRPPGGGGAGPPPPGGSQLGHRRAGLPAARLRSAAGGGVRGRLHFRLQPAGHVPARHQPVPDGDAAHHRL